GRPLRGVPARVRGDAPLRRGAAGCPRARRGMWQRGLPAPPLRDRRSRRRRTRPRPRAGERRAGGAATRVRRATPPRGGAGGEPDRATLPRRLLRRAVVRQHDAVPRGRGVRDRSGRVRAGGAARRDRRGQGRGRGAREALPGRPVPVPAPLGGERAGEPGRRPLTGFPARTGAEALARAVGAPGGASADRNDRTLGAAAPRGASVLRRLALLPRRAGGGAGGARGGPRDLALPRRPRRARPPPRPPRLLHVRGSDRRGGARAPAGGREVV
ncbi:MAG: hypothetical protein AVDCRST_MAG25-276, partial [uncultured Rubrobacteraceae bacterium]